MLRLIVSMAALGVALACGGGSGPPPPPPPPCMPPQSFEEGKARIEAAFGTSAGEPGFDCGVDLANANGDPVPDGAIGGPDLVRLRHLFSP